MITRKMAIPARNEPTALLKTPLAELPFTRCSELPDLEATALLKQQVGHFWPCSAMRVLLAPATLLSGSPFFPCSTSTVVRASFRVSEQCYTALSASSTDLTAMSCQTGLWQIYISYLPRKDQPESLVTSALLSPANYDVFKKAL